MIELVTRPGANKDDGGESEGGIFSLISSIDWRYQVWKAGVTVTDNPFLYQLWYFVFSLLGNYNYFFFAAHLLDVAVGVAALRIILEAITHNGTHQNIPKIMGFPHNFLFLSLFLKVDGVILTL